MQKITIIIVNWNSGKQLADVISSINNFHSGLVKAVIIVDNASTDNSLKLFKDKNGDSSFPLHIIRNNKNLGFAAACNQGAALANSPYLLFLNPDTKLYEDSLTKPVRFMEQRKYSSVGICGIRLIDENGNASIAAANFPTLRVMIGNIFGLSNLLPRVFPNHLISSSVICKDTPVDQVIGAFFLIRKSVFDLCGGFDERFFVYFEEVDLSFRAKQLGYKSYVLSDVAAFHKGCGCSENDLENRLFYSLRSRIYYFKKHFSLIEFTMIVFLTSLEFFFRCIKGLTRCSFSEVKSVFIAYSRLIKFFC